MIKITKNKIHKWFTSRISPVDLTKLNQKNTYILPTKTGLMLGATLIILLIGAINYQISLGYMLTFLLAGCASISAFTAHNTLRGLSLQLTPPNPVFANEMAQLEIKLINSAKKPRYAIGIAIHDQNTSHTKKHWIWADTQPQAQSIVHISYKAPQRGIQELPLLTAQTLYPLGTFRVWTIWKPASKILIYPAPEKDPPPFPQGEPLAGSGLASGSRSTGEFDGVRAYQRGDAMKLIVWKKFAKSEELVSRDTLHIQRQQLWFDFAQTGIKDKEASLSRLCAWILAAEEQELDYGLRLPNTEIKPDSGAAQRLRCLDALAKA